MCRCARDDKPAAGDEGKEPMCQEVEDELSGENCSEKDVQLGPEIRKHVSKSSKILVEKRGGTETETR